MINLMPNEDKRQLAAARTNTLLLRYSTLLGVFIVVLAIEILGVYIILDISKVNNENTIRENDAKSASYAPIKKQADVFRTNLSTAKTILDKRIPYTDIMLALAQSLPSGATIDRIAIDPLLFGTPTMINVKTNSYQSAISIKNLLQQTKVNNVPLFTSVSFESVSAGGGSDGSSFSAVYNVIYSKEVLDS